MAPPPWQETPTKVVVEFQRSAGKAGKGRVIVIKQSPTEVPSQLNGRLAPESWVSFMSDVDVLARTHPYVVAPSAGRVCEWAAGLTCGLITGFCCINPDGGDYGEWVTQAQRVLAVHGPAFHQAGARLSLQNVHGSYWIQIDLDPSIAVMGQPVPMSGMKPSMQGPAQAPYPASY